MDDSKTKQSLWVLYIAQFLSAFADNAIFFVILGILARKGNEDPEGGMLLVQAGFLLAYVVLAPFVGAFADKHKKSSVLLIGNLVKGIGAALLFTGFSPAAAYTLVGIGAVVYSPAKYGVLVEICKEDTELLMKSNGQLESSTIAAILLGTLGGGFLASFSPNVGIWICLLLYGASLALAPWIRCEPGNTALTYGASAKQFLVDVKLLFTLPKTRFTLVGTSAFWMTSSVLRIAFLMWLAKYLHVTESFEQSAIVGITGVGIVIGALLAPYVLPVRTFYRSYLYGAVMMLIILVAVIPVNVYVTAVLLLAIGICGAVFIIPLNTVLQDEGKDRVGSGRTIAIQNFSENLLMMIGVGVFQYLLDHGFEVKVAIIGMGVVLGGFVLYLRMMIPKVRG
ncbi:MAG TPA: lysophospholipid transporter LplT [Bacillota bacterium]|nr:lysophospholipid transporter LplT [Bacillota bacterium]